MISSIYKNFEQFFKVDLGFGDMVRCIANNTSLDPLVRYNQADLFGNHFYMIGEDNRQYSYPSVGVRFGSAIDRDCAKFVRVEFITKVKSCKDPNFIACGASGYCGLVVVDPVEHIEVLNEYILSRFRYIADGTPREYTNIFDQLRCSTYTKYVCDQNGIITTSTEDWGHNIVATQVGDPFRTGISYVDCYYTQMVGINLRVDSYDQPCCN